MTGPVHGASDERTRTILRARARLLARPAADAASDDDAGVMPVLVVRVGADRMAIPLDHVASVGRAGRVTPLPRAVPPVHGVAAWRGRPLTVLVLGMVPSPDGEDRRFVVLGDGRRATVAVLVDAVEDVEIISRSTIGASPAGGASRTVPSLGVTPEGILVVDGDALLRGAS